MHRSLLVMLLIAATLAGCKNETKRMPINRNIKPSYTHKLIADTVIYDVMLRNIDTSDVWESECLQYLDQKAFVDYLFEGIYNQQFTATEFMGNKTLSIKDIKDIEASEGFSREHVSKVQFRERWYIDSLGNFQKEIISYTLGIEVYSKQNSFLGHKALFVVKPNI